MPRLDSNSGGTDERGYIKPRFDAVREAQAREYAQLVERWSDEARAASAAARKAKSKGGNWRAAARATFYKKTRDPDKHMLPDPNEADSSKAMLRMGYPAIGQHGVKRGISDNRRAAIHNAEHRRAGRKGSMRGPFAQASFTKDIRRRADRFGDVLMNDAIAYVSRKNNWVPGTTRPLPGGPKSNDVVGSPTGKNLGKLRIDRSPAISRKRRAYSPAPMMGIPKPGGGWR
jgi:hypothetical protein